MVRVGPSALDGVGIRMLQSEFIRGVDDTVFQTFLLFLGRGRSHCEVYILRETINELETLGKAGLSFEHNIRFRLKEMFQE